jgi:D-alanyl-D-alanine dipeptidase
MQNPHLAQRKKQTRELLTKVMVAGSLPRERGRWWRQEKARQDRHVVLPRQERQQDEIVEREEKYCDEGNWEIMWMG